MGGKKARKNFLPETHVYREQKTMEKKSYGKSAKTRFLWKHEYRDQKMGGGKNARKIFSKNTRILRLLNDGKNRLENVRKHVFYKHMNIVKKNGGKTREKIFPETRFLWKYEYRTKNGGEKTREKFFPETHVYREF